MKPKYPGQLLRKAKVEAEYKASHKKHKKEKMHCKECGGMHEKSHAHFKKHEKKHKKNWIAGAIKKPGALHRELGVKKGNKIPVNKLSKAAKKGGVEGKRARLAQTLKGFQHGKKKAR